MPDDRTVIVHRFGRRGQGLELLVAQQVPGAEIVPWPGPGEVLATLDSAWMDNEDPIPSEVRWVHVFGAGVGNFPLDRLEGRLLTASKGASSPAIAEFVLACMLAFEKRLPETWISCPPERHWGAAGLGGLAGRTLGIVGLGTIGTEVARRAAAFGMDIVAVRRSDRPSEVAGVRVVRDLGAVLEIADHLVVAAPETAATRHLLDAAAFERIKPGVHLVNVARGSLVDQAALLDALDGGRVAMASLDVVDPEPLPAGDRLYTHPKVRLSPHVSWSAPGTFDAMVGLFVDNLRRWRNGEDLRSVVDVEAGY